MKRLALVLVVALASCGGTPEDVETKSSALTSAQIWQSSTPITRIGQTKTCNGISYRLRQPIAQYQAGTGYMDELAGNWLIDIDSSRGEMTILCYLDFYMNNASNALSSDAAQVCYMYSHIAGEHGWTYDGAVTIPHSGVYYAPKGSVHPVTGVTYANGFWRLSMTRYQTPSDGNGRLTGCLSGSNIIDLY